MTGVTRDQVGSGGDDVETVTTTPSTVAATSSNMTTTSTITSMTTTTTTTVTIGPTTEVPSSTTATAMTSSNLLDQNNSSSTEVAAKSSAPPPNRDHTPHHIVYRKMERIIERMQEENIGVPVRTVKSFLTKIPSVFTGTDLVTWILKNMEVDDQNEALHLAHLLAAHGYIFPIEDHILSVKNDSTFYRFQTPYFWPSNYWEPENSDYAVYLCKRTMQNKTRLELVDYEAENLARLQKMFSRKWEFIFMQAEAQSKVDKKRDKLERKVLDSQERAFWDVHRPSPGCVNTTEMDIKKMCRMNRPRHGSSAEAGGSQKEKTLTVDELKALIKSLKYKLDRHSIKISKVADLHVAYYEMYSEYDPFIIAPEPSNPWLSDSLDFWDQEKNAKDIPARRVRRWAFSVEELLKDPVGRDHFAKFLEKEFSGENLRFWESIQDLKRLPMSELPKRAQEIWAEFLAPDSTCLVNVDSKSYEQTRQNIQESQADRWSFDTALAHVYHLMKSDSYSRYIRSDMYKDFLNGAKKKVNFLSLPAKFKRT
ncbi:regulator of G-protein signaling 7 [Folsomia candida]|uniref:regulator of G-protein signaling 7 n=1 Tax=Folsomia candida TaxID=158441 RepID=UPI000B8FA401|nr:regulator of G-protein signaling 7 [Folsomia candida]